MKEKIIPKTEAEFMKKEVYSGIGLGLLIGIIIGLSIAEVTGIVLGALTSLLAAFFGLRSGKDSETGHSVIIGTFGFTCMLSIFLGIYIRTHNLLAPSLKNEMKEYESFNFNKEEIKDIILFKKLGLIPNNKTFSIDAVKVNGSSVSVLMTSEEGLDYLCETTHENSTLDEITKNFDDAGAQYEKLEKGLRKRISNPEELRQTLLLLKTMICEQQNQ